MSDLTIKAQKRTETGKNANNRLTASGRIPVNIIGSGQSALASVDRKDVIHLLNTGVRPATLIDLDLEGENVRVFVQEIQRTPGSNEIRHIDFFKVTPGKKVKTKVGIVTTGSPKGVKAGGRFEHIIHELKVKTTPEDLKDVIEVDVSDLGVGDSIKIKDLPIPQSWDILLKGNPIVTSVNITKALIAQERAAREAATKETGAKKGKGK
ncbi:MAG: 50S ribosomal protein L25 [Leptospiraceae bacterium]|nr:50S ribosomal protein L25 [Leptospiraceae bacterium]MCP5502220.1 50S ribosomal protein L25 [Leptospiraceae bacterium]